jgi:hypothetical protein
MVTLTARKTAITDHSTGNCVGRYNKNVERINYINMGGQMD